MTDLTQFVNDILAPAIYRDPARLFGGSWKRRAGKQVCKQHVVTNGRDARDGIGALIFEDTPYLICDGADAQTNMEIVAWYAEEHSLYYHEAAKAIADIYGIIYNVDESALTPYQKKAYGNSSRRDDLADIKAMAEATGDDSAEAAYLRARGITDAQRRAAYIFAINDGTIRTLVGIHDRHHDEASPIPKGVNDGTHTIGIPILQAGSLVAIYFRTLTDDITPKYTSVKLSRASSLVYGLRRVAPTTQTGRARTLIAVEGAFDAITAQAAVGTGYDVVAYMTAAVREEQARAIAKAGYKTIIHIVDYDGDSKTDNTVRYVRRTAQTLTGAGLTVLVVDLVDESHPDEKQDANSFVQAFGADAFITRVKAATHVTSYITNAIARHAADGTDEARINARRDIVDALTAEPSADIINDILTREGTPTAHLFGNIDSLRTQIIEERQKLVEKAAEEERRRSIANKCAEVKEHARKGEYEEAKKCADEARRLIDGKDKSSDKLALWLTPVTRADIIEEYRGQGGGLVTRWRVATNGKPRTPIIIASGAVTAFTAPTKHGKTKALTNVALMYVDEAEKHNKRVAVIHNEESRGDEVVNLINVLANVVVDPNNKAFIRRCVQEEVSTGNDVIDEARERIFKLIEDGTLVIVSHKPTIEEVEEAVTAGVNEFDAIIYDYIQRSRTDDAYISTKDKIKHVMDILNDIAAKTGLPIVTASQFNRQCSSPTDMDLTKNAEASDIEWTLSKCIGLFSSLRRPVEGALFYTEAGDNGKLAGQIVNAGFNVMDTEHPSMYMRILADREGLSDTWGVMEYNGNTGYIGLNRQELW